jgi:hypothetical protein
MSSSRIKRAFDETVTSSSGRIIFPSKVRCHCTTAEDEAEIDADIAELEAYEEEKTGGGHYWGRVSSSQIVPVFSSPVKELQQRMREKPFYISPSKTIVTEISENGSAKKRRTMTPRKREFVRSFKSVLSLTSESGLTETIEVEFFQSQKSALQRKKRPNLFAEDVENVENKCPNPESNVYQIKRDRVTVNSLEKAALSKHKISWQHKGLKASAIGFQHGFTEEFDSLEHSHMKAHRHEQKQAVGDRLDKYRTFPARREHNSMRLVSAEIPEVGKCIKLLKELFYSDKTTLLKNEDGEPVPVVQCEEVTWEDRRGNKVYFKYDALNGVTPAKELEYVSAELYREAFFGRRKLFSGEAVDKTECLLLPTIKLRR